MHTCVNPTKRRPGRRAHGDPGAYPKRSEKGPFVLRRGRYGPRPSGKEFTDPELALGGGWMRAGRVARLSADEERALAQRAKLIAADVVALDKFEGSCAGRVFTHEFDRPGRGVNLPDGLHQGIERDRVIGIFLCQVQKLLRKRIAVLVHLANKVQPFRVGEGFTAARRFVVFLAKSFVLLCGDERFVLALAHGGEYPQVYGQKQDSFGYSLHSRVPRFAMSNEALLQAPRSRPVVTAYREWRHEHKRRRNPGRELD